MEALSRREILPEKNKDHALVDDWIGHRECHIQPDWLLAPLKLYTDNSKALVMTPAGVFYDESIYNYSCVLYPCSAFANIKNKQ
ncbi:MAG: type II toxin-antitoxin system YafQ family toxin [Lachnospiraceae bacterium]|nr:type II toxin-antitoxin system YafQ family toxin [Lachnospiraceae bacterium]